MCGWVPKVSASSVEILNSIFQSLTSDDICQFQFPTGEVLPGTLNSLSCQSHCVLLGKNIPISERWLILFEFFPIWWILGYSGWSRFCLPWPLEAGRPPPSSTSHTAPDHQRCVISCMYFIPVSSYWYFPLLVSILLSCHFFKNVS